VAVTTCQVSGNPPGSDITAGNGAVGFPSTRRLRATSQTVVSSTLVLDYSPVEPSMIDLSDKKTEVLCVRKELEDSKGTRIWTDYVNALKLFSQVVFTRSSGFIRELIQNAEDAGLGLEQRGVITVNVSHNRLKFVHNGNPFDGGNLRSICGIRSSKKPERGTLGYLGIGFKSVFKVADCAEVYSNGFQFKFDRNHEEWIDHSGDTPWHVIPVWMDAPSEQIDREKTTFIIRFRDNSCYQSVMDALIQLKAELYLFLKWIKEIHVDDEDSGKSWELENAEEKDRIAVLKHDDQVLRI
jgi:hypothetical protein